ncbi:MAG: hypothetical protein S4CHLAM45_03540 [Chlamydiales bacterium]|nr:hypothetical protein [Chlamydiales bacterium]MCH9619209.1 hypothetical protein [Chlamydiales bacterium]MCH9622471.1 hypothetical protein [Chlamydiales bacterium]
MKEIDRLIEGNQAFLKTHPKLPIPKQEPFCAVLTCADARLSPELIFQQKMGDLFVVRQAGNKACPSAIESIRLGISLLNIELVVVLGHQACAALEKDQIIPNIHEQVGILKKECPTAHVVGAYFSFEDGTVRFLQSGAVDNSPTD